MSKTPKIEDLFSEVSSNIKFESTKKKEILPKIPKKDDLSFTQVLDFAFPGEIRDTKVIQVGEITYVGDGVIHVTGLANASIDEMIEVNTAGGGMQRALILGITEKQVEAVVLGDYSKIKRGDEARSTGTKLRMPVGENIVGRVVNPLGEPLDGKGKVTGSGFRDVEFPAPGVLDRAPITEAMHTGIMVIDTTIPIGRGQRELVIGDRKTGKTRTMLDIICNQKGHNIHCIYVGIGVQAAKAKTSVKMLADRGAMDYTTVVIALANEPPTLQYIAPYAGTAIAEHLMYQGKNCLIVYDDLSKQAKAYRQVALLLKRSPGRDAYPGDIFFLHSRLLERSSRTSEDLGDGSITALPVAETQAGDVSDYIITNLMSITDGHIYLDANLMHEGILPAVDSGTSVSRIGGKVQTPMLRKVGELAGRVLARYNEVKSFETINTEVSDDTLRDIKSGKRVRELLAQDSSLNLSSDEEVLILALGTSSRMNHFEMPQVIIFKENIIPYYRDLKLDKFKVLADTAKDLKEIDKFLDEIFIGFCRKFELPIMAGEIKK